MDCLTTFLFSVVFIFVNGFLFYLQGNTVAIKQLSLEKAPKEVFDSLQTEIELLKSLRHENIGKSSCFYLFVFEKKKNYFKILLVRYIDHVVNKKTNQLYIAME